ncbi:MAG TPA: hypothetical protein VFZ58_00530 [Candidatus Saccharimonadales bacterium]
MAEQRLPIVNSDDGVWGDIIRQYIMKEHYNDDTNNPINGSHKTITIQPGTATAGTAPLKFNSGTVLSAPEAGAMEFNNDTLFFTITTGSVRKKVAIYDDTAGATGDLYYRNSSGQLVRLGVGSAGQYLRISGGLPGWNDATLATTTKTSSYTIAANDTVIFANASSGAVTITLPVASGVAGYRFYVKRLDNSGNTCSVARSGSDTIDGQTSISLNVQYTSLTLASDGNAWYIL